MAETPHDYALTDKTAVKESLGITTSDDDSLITRLINASTDHIESACGRRFKDTTYTEEEYDGQGEDELILKQFPITETAAVVVKIDDEVVDSENYKVYDGEGMIYYQRWPTGRKNIKITYSAGYVSIPSDLAQACIELVATIYSRRKSGGVKNERIGDYSITYADIEASPLARKTIELYRSENL